MNMSPGASVKLELEKDGIAMVRNVQMTKDNRQLVWKYNNEKTDIISTNKIDIQKQHNDKKYEKKYSDKKVIHTQAGLFTIKAARITYEYSGMTKGTDILYFDDYGETVVLIQNRPSEIYGGTKTIIYRDGRTTIINHDRKNAAKSAFRPKDTEPPSIATASNRESEGYEKLPNESIAGRECEVYHNNTINAKYWLWNNIDLRLENYSLGNNGYIKSATNVQIISAIPTELFLIPEGYEKRYNK
ncbi:MAG: hypothetical protein U5L96_06430 [Owenweeksia sp.]|nr:hypothetical protein [Owenweeksia sp.]